MGRFDFDPICRTRAFHQYKAPRAFERYLMNARGMTLLEVMIAAGIMSVVALGMMTLVANQTRATNYLDFQLKRTQLQGAILGQFLNNPDNCACLFTFPTAPGVFAANQPPPGITLSGVSPTSIGPYNFATPGNCATASLAQTFASSAGIDSIRLNSVNLTNIVSVAPNSYSGNLMLNLSSIKPVIGSNSVPISIPVSIQTTTSGANVAFKSCSTAAAATVNSTYKLYCGATIGNITAATCFPGSCAAGESSLPLNCKGTGIISGWQNFNCEKLCVPGTLPSGYTYETGCPYMGRTGGSGWLPSSSLKCTPPPCRIGDVDAAAPTCYPIAATGAGWLAGTCSRFCRAP